MLKTDVDINSDDNADWIKLVHGGKAQKKELATHRKLDRENKKNNTDKTDTTSKKKGE